MAAEPVFDPDPGHLWNRVYRGIAMRSELGVDYGDDAAEPFSEPFDDPASLVKVLDEFLATRIREPASGSVARALLLNDLWAAFDLAVRRDDEHGLPPRLARALRNLAMPRLSIAALPDNYAAAVKSAAFPKDFDPAHPEIAFLPPDLFNPNGDWVQVANYFGGPVASQHVAMVSGRSAFLVFIRCPGGREPTLAYLRTLNFFPTPYQLKQAELGTVYNPQPAETVRTNVLRLDPQTPQFPEGTVFALVRRMIVLDDGLKPVPTEITQQIQFRVYRKFGLLTGGHATRASFPASQAVSEFVMQRRQLLAGRTGGLRAVGPEEHGYQLQNVPMGGTRAERLRGDVVLTSCGRCHGREGIFSVNSYGGQMSMRAIENPQLLPVGDAAQQLIATADWKRQQFNYGVLRGLLAHAR
ncbi:MAG: hypothetical protein ABI821_15045 [Pseudomonadota bacterium]